MKFATEERLITVCDRHGVPKRLASKVFQNLTEKYSEPHRAYHNFEHVDDMLGLFTKCAYPDDEVELAIWFHDAIYDPAAEHNERKSANYFLSQLNGYFWDDFSREVERLILVTDPSTKHLGTPREGLMVDLDLSILGSSPEAYLEYSKAVRKEYSFASDEDFNHGRSEILQSILKDKIFVTEHFTHLEEQARTNITEELERLGAEN